jgi:signal transduction histidine kinase
VLVCAPFGRDAELARESLGAAGLQAEVCPDVAALCQALAAGAAALLLTEEALSPEAVDQLLASLEAQPSWSDLGLVVLVSGGPSTPASAIVAARLAPRSNVTLLERPVRPATLVSALRAALRARQRQYQLRDQLQARAEAETAQRRAHAEAERAARIRDQFMASVAHDLKNPLGAIKGHAQLLRRRASRPDPPPVDALVEGLSRIEAMVTRTVSQIDELLDLARLQTNRPLDLNPAPTDLVEVARRVVEEHHQAAPEYAFTVQATVPQLFGVWDEPRLERVLGNLLANAVKYSPVGSPIDVSVEPERPSGESWAVLRVRDRGIGIPAADLPRLFEPFYRASNVAGRQPGTGLGLAGARQIVEQHGGTVAAESREGEGSTFTVRLPTLQTDGAVRLWSGQQGGQDAHQEDPVEHAGSADAEHQRRHPEDGPQVEQIGPNEHADGTADAGDARRLAQGEHER